MKHSLLYCLAATSLTLSFFYDRTPATDPSTAPAPVLTEASLFPSWTPATPAPPAADHTAASSRDSLAYNYYAHTLGLKLDFDENKALLRTVTDWLGTPYRYGSSTRRGTDCSGFVSRVFQEVYGITLQRSSRSMFQSVKRISKTEMEEGDLVFFRRGPGQPIYHVGIYLKDGKFAHSATTGGVMISSLRQAYYNRNFYAAGRVETN
ncbi:NLP/P60 protein [Hymenobacter roseosalivarius DSM 11622]|uniref:NLP/P60 protein n=1 Tax=Hymenobacter roseosalivarius DSM 11622 TaxID=645990 RepID=A0A1W1UY22_9BACT|nr:NlpC/P60 family protein [Hymenobacter roseosalivarius]SMB86018.1 NLP/P60 protein [Hymenobacter roseosalivarius DSM 11622]